MTDLERRQLRNTVELYIYYSLRGATCGDDTPRDILRNAFRIIRNWISRGESLEKAVSHVESLGYSASLA